MQLMKKLSLPSALLCVVTAGGFLVGQEARTSGARALRLSTKMSEEDGMMLLANKVMGVFQNLAAEHGMQSHFETRDAGGEKEEGKSHARLRVFQVNAMGGRDAAVSVRDRQTVGEAKRVRPDVSFFQKIHESNDPLDDEHQLSLQTHNETPYFALFADPAERDAWDLCWPPQEEEKMMKVQGNGEPKPREEEYTFDLGALLMAALGRGNEARKKLPRPEIFSWLTAAEKQASTYTVRFDRGDLLSDERRAGLTFQTAFDSNELPADGVPVYSVGPAGPAAERLDGVCDGDNNPVDRIAAGDLAVAVDGVACSSIGDNNVFERTVWVELTREELDVLRGSDEVTLAGARSWCAYKGAPQSRGRTWSASEQGTTARELEAYMDAERLKISEVQLPSGAPLTGSVREKIRVALVPQSEDATGFWNLFLRARFRTNDDGFTMTFRRQPALLRARDEGADGVDEEVLDVLAAMGVERVEYRVVRGGGETGSRETQKGPGAARSSGSRFSRGSSERTADSTLLGLGADTKTLEQWNSTQKAWEAVGELGSTFGGENSGAPAQVEFGRDRHYPVGANAESDNARELQQESMLHLRSDVGKAEFQFPQLTGPVLQRGDAIMLVDGENPLRDPRFERVETLRKQLPMGFLQVPPASQSAVDAAQAGERAAELGLGEKLRTLNFETLVVLRRNENAGAEVFANPRVREYVLLKTGRDYLGNNQTNMDILARCSRSVLCRGEEKAARCCGGRNKILTFSFPPSGTAVVAAEDQESAEGSDIAADDAPVRAISRRECLERWEAQGLGETVPREVRVLAERLAELSASHGVEFGTASAVRYPMVEEFSVAV